MKRLSCDVLVVGGGVTGVCAALAAARRGAVTLLAESRLQLGGTGTAGLLQHICGLYLHGANPPVETLNGGLCAEIAALLGEKAPRRTVNRIGQVFVLPCEGGDLLSILTVLCAAERNLTVLTGTELIGGDGSGGRIVTVSLIGGDGALEVTPEVAIDCTGNANLAFLAGAPCELSPVGERQLAGFTIKVSGLRKTDPLLPVKVPYWCAKGVEQGVLPPLLRFTTFFAGDEPEEGFCKLSLDGDDGQERNNRAHEWARLLLDYLGRVLPPFEQARISAMAARVLDREGRRIAGECTLTEDDVVSARKFTDGVVKNAWPVEFWDGNRGVRYRYLPPGEYYEIPLRCLKVSGVDNLLAAGRCISATPAALASARVMGTCMALGEQAGLAAVRYLQG